ncbi:MAG TPA: YezD family protein [Bacillota bacterium]|jgi:hypothetical protein
MSMAHSHETAFPADRAFLRKLMDDEWFNELLRFLKDTRFGSFTVVVQDGKVIGYDELTKRRIGRS